MLSHGLLPGDDAALRDAISCANLPTLLMVLVHLTGDTGLMRGAIRPQRAAPQRIGGGLSDAQAHEVRERAFEVLREFRERGAPLPPLPSREVLAEMMGFSLGLPVAPEYVPMMLEDMGLSPAAPALPLGPRAREFRVLVVGAGMSGLLAAIKLRELGVAVSVIEKNADVGGTWFENSYPGCRVDLPNHFYSYSFEPNHDWPDHFSRRDELLAYFRRIAGESGVRELIRFQTEVVSADYEAEHARWRVRVRAADGTESLLYAEALISAVGQLNRPSIPALPGLSSFAGAAFHTARWQHDVELRGRRVGVIGNGASAMQVVPKIAPDVEQLTIFQRSPQWAAPNPDYFNPVAAGKKWLLRHVPYYAAWYRFRLFFVNGDGVHASLRVDPAWPEFRRSINADNDRIRKGLTDYIEQQLGERRDLRDKVVPDYPPFAKRMLIDNHWFRTLTRDNVELVTERIAEVTPDGIRTESGAQHRLDVIVFGTGFQATRFLSPMQIRGAAGEALHARWGDDARAHLGITVPGFPNFFMLYGPNTNLAHGGSIIFHSECQVRYIAGCLRLLFEGDHDALDCTEAAHAASNARVDAEHAAMVWTHPHVGNWFRNAAGRITTNSPYRLVDYWSMTERPNPDDFSFLRATTRPR